MGVVFFGLHVALDREVMVGHQYLDRDVLLPEECESLHAPM